MVEARHDSSDFRREYLSRLPLPIAQLYSRAYNAKDARGRHDNSFYVCEALVKLAASVGVSAYLTDVESGMPRVPALDRLMAQLALPSFGQWLGILREVSRFYGERPDAASVPLGHVWKQLTARHLEKSSLLELFCRIKNGPDGHPSRDTSVSLLDLFDSLVQYRNGVFGHGAGRFDSFYESDFGPRLFPAVNELLEDGLFDLLGPRGSRLVYLTEIRKRDNNHFEIRLDELSDRESLRLDPFELNAAEAARLVPNCVAVRWPGRRVPLRLDPLLAFRGSEQGDEVLFLNRDRYSKQVEYLSYTTGRTERDRTMAPALAGLLSRISHRTVTVDELATFSDQSLTETPSVEQFFASVSPQGTVRGDFEILAELGRGGMGVVYLARQLSLGRLVALKTLPTDLVSDEVAIARFKREIRSLSRCDDPHVVKLLSSGTFDDNGQAYFAMEYIPGCDLEHVWREATGQHRAEINSLGDSTWRNAVSRATQSRRETLSRSRFRPAISGAEVNPAANSAQAEERSIDQFLPPIPQLPDEKENPGSYVRRIVQLIRDAARALQVVHGQQLIHRDVSPANLMVTPNGERLVLMDFGLAKGETQSSLSISGGGLLGKLRYAAPEQMAAATLHVGPTADIRGLGVTLWELLSRQRLFGDAADERELAQRIHDEDVPLLRTIDRSIDRDLQAIVARACERAVKDRIPTAEKLADYLDLYLEGRPIPIREPSTGELVWRWIKQHRGLVSTAVTALVLVVTTVVVSFVLVKRSETTALQLAKEKGILAVEKTELAEKEKEAREVAVLSEADARNKTFLAQRLLYAAHMRLAHSAWEAARVGQTIQLLEEHQPRIDQAEPIVDFRNFEWRYLYRLSHSYLLNLDSHRAEVMSVAFSPDGRQVATASMDRSIKLWDSANGHEIKELVGHTKEVTSVDFSADGAFLTSASYDGSIKMWALESGLCERTFNGHNGLVMRAVFSPDSDYIASAGRDGTVKLWNSFTGEELYSLTAHEEGVQDVSFSKDGRLLASCGFDNDVKVWDVAAGQRLFILAGHESLVTSVCFSPDGTTIASSSWDRTIKIWDVLQQKLLKTLSGHNGYAWSVAFNPDGTQLASSSHDNTIKLWSVANGHLLHTLKGHQGKGVMQVTFSPDGSRLASACYDRTAKVWSTTTPQENATIGIHPGFIYSLAINSDGSRIVSGGGAFPNESKTGDPRVWDAHTGEQLFTLAGHAGNISCVTFSSDDTRVFSAGDDHTIKIWNAKDGNEIATLEGHLGRVHGIQVGPAPNQIVSASDDGTIKVWDLESRQEVKTLRQEGVSCIAISPDKKVLASAHKKGAMSLWDLSSGEISHTFAGHTDVVMGLSFSTDSTRLASVSLDETVKIWDIENRKESVTLKGHTGAVTCVSISPDGSRLATGSEDETVRMWDLSTGEEVLALTGHSRAIRALTFSRDGQQLITGGDDTFINVWNSGKTKEENSR